MGVESHQIELDFAAKTNPSYFNNHTYYCATCFTMSQGRFVWLPESKYLLVLVPNRYFYTIPNVLD